MNADAVQAQVPVHANVTFLFCDYFMHVTDIQFLQTLMKNLISQTFAESDAKRGTNIGKGRSSEMKMSTSICETMSLLFT